MNLAKSLDNIADMKKAHVQQKNPSPPKRSAAVTAKADRRLAIKEYGEVIRQKRAKIHVIQQLKKQQMEIQRKEEIRKRRKIKHYQSKKHFSLSSIELERPSSAPPKMTEQEISKFPMSNRQKVLHDPYDIGFESFILKYNYPDSPDRFDVSINQSSQSESAVTNSGNVNTKKKQYDTSHEDISSELRRIWEEYKEDDIPSHTDIPQKQAILQQNIPDEAMSESSSTYSSSDNYDLEDERQQSQIHFDQRFIPQRPTHYEAELPEENEDYIDYDDYRRNIAFHREDDSMDWEYDQYILERSGRTAQYPQDSEEEIEIVNLQTNPPEALFHPTGVHHLVQDRNINTPTPMVSVSLDTRSLLSVARTPRTNVTPSSNQKHYAPANRIDVNNQSSTNIGGYNENPIIDQEEERTIKFAQEFRKLRMSNLLQSKGSLAQSKGSIKSGLDSVSSIKARDSYLEDSSSSLGSFGGFANVSIELSKAYVPHSLNEIDPVQQESLADVTLTESFPRRQSTIPVELLFQRKQERKEEKSTVVEQQDDNNMNYIRNLIAKTGSPFNIVTAVAMKRKFENKILKYDKEERLIDSTSQSKINIEEKVSQKQLKENIDPQKLSNIEVSKSVRFDLAPPPQKETIYITDSSKIVEIVPSLQPEIQPSASDPPANHFANQFIET
jgi:hypothetical protein